VGGVAFAGDVMRACLWLRTANRVLLPVAEFACGSEKDLYEGVRQVAWHERLTPKMTLAVDANVRDSVLTHSKYVALKTKDAIVDQLRDRLGTRPSVDVAAPDVQINVRLFRNRAQVSLDASGGSLHERGYRVAGGEAPMKETLAAAVLLLAGWKPREQPLLNPMCGTGTIAIEAAWMAADHAPALLRKRFGFERWIGFDARKWRELREEATGRARSGRGRGAIFASDLNVEAAHRNARAAGVAEVVRLEKRDLRAVRPPVGPTGIVAVNPPYGERLGDEQELAPLYTALGDLFKHEFAGWTAFIFTGNPKLGKMVGLRTSRRDILYNGAIECRLLRYELYPLKRAEPK
jgi:23S rRNA (guanine2445-N2)-methyltransferase